MGTMIVAKPFVLTRNDGQRVSYGFGVHENVPDEDARHPYAQHFLAPNGRLPEPAAAAPLTHEERIAMKASLDDANERVRLAEEESRTARSAHDALKVEHERVTADFAVAKGRLVSLEAENTSSMKEIGDARARADAAEKRVADLTADLDRATKPAAPKPAAAPAK